MQARGKEISTPSKFAWGTIIAGLSSLIMVIAAISTNIYEHKVSSAWIFASYGVFTISELFMSPVGLSLVSKVAPRRFTALMMGGWFVATAIGNKLTQIGQLWDDWLHSTFWIFCSACALFMALVLLTLLRPLKKAMPGV